MLIPSLIPSTSLRRARGVFGIGLTWAVVWAVGGASFYALVKALFPPPAGADTSFWIVVGGFAVWWGVAGALVGSSFAIIFMLAEHHRGLGKPWPTRTGGWGALGGALFPLLAGLLALLSGGQHLVPERLVVETGVLAILGSACAVGTLALAFREPRNPRLPPAVGKQKAARFLYGAGTCGLDR